MQPPFLSGERNDNGLRDRLESQFIRDLVEVSRAWDSAEHLQRFRDEKLLPALRDAGAEGEMTPEVNEAYRVITK
jgi:hypothetical protein